MDAWILFQRHVSSFVFISSRRRINVEAIVVQQ